jgi:hypothetical protein
MGRQRKIKINIYPSSRKKHLTALAKIITHQCVRNNTSLEDIHSGKIDITNNENMKKLMIEICNNIFTALAAFDHSHICEAIAIIDQCYHYNEPEMPIELIKYFDILKSKYLHVNVNSNHGVIKIKDGKILFGK